ncbi:hypothetical protein F5Y00DRAFT_262204 [Daldinia vernicosa]|uniref:uncharacterized protein n=1 Tax=Daldinia vernicosa TaxID=114800 RepID=UPI002008AC30|nr:uncharacterized protein F5Y00DRAFT_262204 [Daldinia vernicosa]KAI0848733.1 hypothetical protein F5Y00DRAFT_262204 [Daldinia vernicosa]
MSNLGALTTAYQPDRTDCQSIHLGSTTDGEFLQQGTISGCLPSNFQPENNYYYSPGVCPQGYTYACTADVVSRTPDATAATCCPGNSNFVCRPRVAGDPNACESTLTSAALFAVDVFTYISHTPSKIGTTNVFYDAGAVVLAKGPIVWRAAKDVEWPISTSFNLTTTGSTSEAVTSMPSATASMPIATSSQNLEHSVISTPTTEASSDIHESNNLSIGAKVGIGLGVSLGVLFFLGITVVAYIIGKRKGHNADKGCQDPQAPKYELDEQRRVLEMATYREPVELMSSHS